MSKSFSGINKCLFCYGSTHSLIQNENHLTLQQIISSCNTHLTQKLIVGIDWKSIYSIGRSFCQECYKIVEKLVSFAEHLERIQNDIKELDSKLLDRVSRERIINQPPNDPFNRSEEYFTEENYDMPCVESPGTGDNEDEPETSPESSNRNINQDKTRKKSAKKKIFTDSKKDSTLSTAPKPKGVVLLSEVERQLANKDTPGYECEKCHKRFSRIGTLHSHDCSKKTFECEVCNVSFSDARARRRHMQSHTGEKPFECETCGKCFSMKPNMTIHMRTHTVERPFKCDICPKTFREKIRLSKHVVAIHETETHEKLYKCDVCYKSFRSLQQLKRHSLSRHHKGDRPHKCVTCGKSYSRKHLLRQHQQLVNYHSGEKPFKCETCDKAFPSKILLNMHVKCHGEKLFSCEECGKSFFNKAYLATHTLKHTEQGPFICETCGKTYSSLFRLKEHIKHYHDDGPNKCVPCNKVFKNKSLLITHQKAMDCEGPPFKCIQCDKTFNHRTERERHRILEHVSEKNRPTFACEQCQEIFHLRTDLQYHVNKIHPPSGQLHCDTCKLEFKDIRTLKLHKYNSKVQCRYCPQKFSSRCDHYMHSVHYHFRGFKQTKQRSGFCKLCALTFVDPDVFRDHMKSVHPTASVASIIKPSDKLSQSSGSRIIMAMNCDLESGQTDNSISNWAGDSDESDKGVEITNRGSEQSDHDEIEIKEEEEFGMEDSEIKTECYYESE